MQQSAGQRSISAPIVLGVVLIALGAVTLLLRDLGYTNLFASIGAWGWPFFIIVPGLVLLAASLVPARPRGIGFATAGAIVTTVGALLLYQSRTGHWESWSYAWALLPLAAGVAMAAYGFLARERGMVTTGTTMAAIGAALFLAGAWFFEGLFADEARPTNIGEWWPIGVIVLGGVLVLRAVLAPGTPAQPELPARETTVPPAGPAQTV